MTYYKSKLLTFNNHKTLKSKKLGISTYILYMSPYKDNSKGINLCPHASKGCSTACLFNSGFGGMYQGVIDGRKNKTEWFLNNPKEFMLTLVGEITQLCKKHGNKLALRLNGTSDIRYEKIKIDGYNTSIFDIFPDVMFYDYTKNPKRFTQALPKNYHLTFSRSETNELDVLDILNRGYNVACVFDVLPKTYMGFEVINGDDHDLRYKDKKGVIVGLTYKNATGKGGGILNKYAKESGFVISE